MTHRSNERTSRLTATSSETHGYMVKVTSSCEEVSDCDAFKLTHCCRTAQPRTFGRFRAANMFPLRVFVLCASFFFNFSPLSLDENITVYLLFVCVGLSVCCAYASKRRWAYPGRVLNRVDCTRNCSTSRLWCPRPLTHHAWLSLRGAVITPLRGRAHILLMFQ